MELVIEAILKIHACTRESDLIALYPVLYTNGTLPFDLTPCFD